MAQQIPFPQAVNNGNQPQRTMSAGRTGQAPRVAVETKINRRAGEQAPQRQPSQPSSKQYPPSSSNRAVPAAAGVRPEPQDDGQVRLFGWIGRYFEVKPTRTGVLRATFSIATPKASRDQSGREIKQTVWQRIVVWGSEAAEVQRRLRKGARVHIEGKLKTREWTDRENNLHTTTELVARSVRFLDMPESEIVA